MTFCLMKNIMSTLVKEKRKALTICVIVRTDYTTTHVTVKIDG